MQPYLGFCSSHANTKDVARKTICDHLRKQGQPQEELYIRKKNKEAEGFAHQIVTQFSSMRACQGSNSRRPQVAPKGRRTPSIA